MPISIPLSPTLLQPLLPLREALASSWETILVGLATAPDPALAAAHLSRLAEHGFGRPDEMPEVALLRSVT